MKIGKYTITTGGVYVIAEIGKNHNGSLTTAKTLIEQAYTAGAHAVKFQSYDVDSLLHSISPNEPSVEWLRQCQLSQKDHQSLFEFCGKLGITFLSTPESLEWVDFLDKLGVPAFKVSSLNLTNYQMLSRIKSKKKPVILSTGMGKQKEIEAALSILGWGNDIALLHCVSLYPTPLNRCNLAVLKRMRRYYQRPVGWSDHTGMVTVPLLAYVLGASIIEVHFTLNTEAEGPDHCFSFTFDKLKSLVNGIGTVNSIIGSGIKQPCEEEECALVTKRRCIVAANDIMAGEYITNKDLTCKCPGMLGAYQADEIDTVIGKVTTVDIKKNTPITKEMVVI